MRIGVLAVHQTSYGLARQATLGLLQQARSRFRRYVAAAEMRLVEERLCDDAGLRRAGPENRRWNTDLPAIWRD